MRQGHFSPTFPKHKNSIFVPEMTLPKHKNPISVPKMQENKLCRNKNQ